MRAARLILMLALVAVGAQARAQSTCPDGSAGCDESPFVQHYAANVLPTLDFDTGYLPGGSPLQIRAALHVAGTSTVHLSATQAVYWPPSIRAKYVPDTNGYVSIDYGLSLGIWVRFDLLGITWEGQIPIPGLPSDLAMSATVALDDLVLTGATPKPVSVSDATSRIRVLTYDLLSFLNAIGGSGGVSVDLQASLAATYDTKRIVLNRTASPITVEGTISPIYPVNGSDYGPFLDLSAHTEGTLNHRGTVHLYPTIFLTLLGQGFDLALFDVPIDLVNDSRGVTFPTVSRRVPLPDVGIDVVRLDFGSVTVGTTSTKRLVVRNDGSATLILEPSVDGIEYGLANYGPISVDPGRSVDLAPLFSASVLGNVTRTLSVRTNDPDSPLKRITLTAVGVLPGTLSDGGVLDGSLADGGVNDGGSTPDGRVGVGGCGCRAVGGPARSAPAVSLLALVAVALRLRRKR